MEPVLAECLDASPPVRPSRSAFEYLFCILMLALVVLAGALVALRATWSTPAPTSQLTYSPPPFSVEEVQQLIPQLFDGRMHVATEEHRDVRELLKQIDANNAPEVDDLTTFIDWPAQIGKFLAPLAPLTDAQRADLTIGRVGAFKLPIGRFEYRLADVRSYGDRDLLVATYAKRFGDTDSILFHLRRHGAALRVADWWHVEMRNWRANIDAPLNAPSAPIIDGHERFEELAREANQARSVGNVAAARQRLLEMEKLRHPPTNRDWRMMLLATHWAASEDDDEAATILERVSDRQAIPCVERIWAGIHLRAGRYEEALEATNVYERHLGFSIEVMQDRLVAAHKLGQDALALETAQRLLGFDPEDGSILRDVLDKIPEDQFAPLVAAVPRSDLFCRRMSSSLSMMLHGTSSEKVPPLRDALAETYGDEHVEIMRLDSGIARRDGRLEQALELQRQVVERMPPNSAARRRELWNWVDTALVAMTPRQVYDAWPEKREVLRAMWRDGEDIDEGGLIEEDELAELVDEHRRQDIDDPRLPRYEAAVAMHQGEDQKALAAYATLLEAAKKELSTASAVGAQIGDSQNGASQDGDFRNTEDENDSDDELGPEEQVAQYERMILALRFKLGESLSAYRESNKPAEAFRQLAELNVAAKDVAVLRELMAAHTHRVPGDPWLTYFLCRLDEWELRPDAPAEDWRALEARYQELIDRVPPPDMVFLIRERLRELALGAPDLAGRLAGPTVHAWPFFAVVRELETRDDPSLLDIYLRNLSDSGKMTAEIADFRIDKAWERRDFAAVLDELDAFAKLENQNEYRKPWDRQRRFLSLLHVDRHDEARGLLELDEAIDSELMLEATQRNWQRVAELLQPLDEIPKGPLLWAFERKSFPALDEFLSSDEWHSITREKPLAALGTGASYDFLLLRSSAQEWSADALAATLEDAGLTDVEVKEVPDAIATQRSFLVGMTTDEFIVTIGSRPLEDRRPLSKLGSTPATANLRPLVDHQGWIAIERHNASYNETRTRSAPLAAALADDQTLGVAAWFSQWQAFVTDSKPEFWERCRASKPIGRAGGQWTRLSADPVRDESGKPFLTTRITHRERCEAVLAGEPPGRATIIRRHGFAAERLEVDVISVQHTGWGNYQLEGRLVSDSSYQPYQRAGSLIQFDPSINLSW